VLNFFFRLIVIIFLPMASNVFAATQTRDNLWLSVDLGSQFKPGSKWNYDVTLQPRFAGNQVPVEQVLLRPAVFYQYNKQWSFWAGYDFIPTIPEGTTKVFYEQRVWPQIEYDKELNNYMLVSGRLRYEVRWQNESSQIATRLRPRCELTLT